MAQRNNPELPSQGASLDQGGGDIPTHGSPTPHLPGDLKSPPWSPSSLHCLLLSEPRCVAMETTWQTQGRQRRCLLEDLAGLAERAHLCVPCVWGARALVSGAAGTESERVHSCARGCSHSACTEGSTCHALVPGSSATSTECSLRNETAVAAAQPPECRHGPGQPLTR